MDDEAWMRRALAAAERAAELGEVPVGAVIVRGGEVIAEAYNRREMFASDAPNSLSGATPKWRSCSSTSSSTVAACDVCRRGESFRMACR